MAGHGFPWRGVVAAGLFIWPAMAQVTQTCSVLDGAGSVATGGTYVSATAIGQSGGYLWSSNSTLQHFGGFLSGAPLKPALDDDHDGLINELDSDNDADALSDYDELCGTTWAPASAVSNPNRSDTDDDGASDWAEFVAGTNPTDATKRLSILALAAAPASNGVVVTWSARKDRNYRLLRIETLAGASSAATVGVTTAVGGLPPWLETTSLYYDVNILSSNAATYFYSVQVGP